MGTTRVKSASGRWMKIGRTANDGQPGKAVVLRAADGYIQWQYEGDTAWINLISLAELKGDPEESGGTVELQVDSGYIQWRSGEASDWVNLIAVADLKGEPGTGTPGRGVSSIAWDAEQSAWIVTYTDGTTENIGGPDLSDYIPQRIETTEPADEDIAEGEIVWIGEVVT